MKMRRHCRVNLLICFLFFFVVGFMPALADTIWTFKEGTDSTVGEEEPFPDPACSLTNGNVSFAFTAELARKYPGNELWLTPDSSSAVVDGEKSLDFVSLGIAEFGVVGGAQYDAEFFDLFAKGSELRIRNGAIGSESYHALAGSYRAAREFMACAEKAKQESRNQSWRFIADGTELSPVGNMKCGMMNNTHIIVYAHTGDPNSPPMLLLFGQMPVGADLTIQTDEREFDNFGEPFESKGNLVAAAVASLPFLRELAEARFINLMIGRQVVRVQTHGFKHAALLLAECIAKDLGIPETLGTRTFGGGIVTPGRIFDNKFLTNPRVTSE